MGNPSLFEMYHAINAASMVKFHIVEKWWRELKKLWQN